MDFSYFLNNVPKLAKEILPATEAHLKMVPPERIEYLNQQNLDNKFPKQAAVLMLIYPKKKISHLALIVRTSYPGIHASQISFPGGKMEVCDDNLAETALRETQEEIGIPREKVNLIKEYSKVYIPPSNYLVSPFLGICAEELDFILNPEEVSSLIELPVEQFLDENIVVKVKMSTSYATNLDVPAFQIGNHLIWGATAMMMSELKETIKKAV